VGNGIINIYSSIRGDEVKMKKTYNPFTMWVAGVGFSAPLFLAIVIKYWDCINRLTNVCFIDNIVWKFPIFWSILLFLIGWGIHSLFRKYSK